MIVDIRFGILESELYVIKEALKLDRLPTREEVEVFFTNKAIETLSSVISKNQKGLDEYADKVVAEYANKLKEQKLRRESGKKEARLELDREVAELRERIKVNVEEDPSIAEKTKLPEFVQTIHLCDFHARFPKNRDFYCGMNGCYSTVQFENNGVSIIDVAVNEVA